MVEGGSKVVDFEFDIASYQDNLNLTCSWTLLKNWTQNIDQNKFGSAWNEYF